MKKKKMYFIVIGSLIIILSIILWSYFNREEVVTSKSNEIIPEKEITDDQMRNTIISLYFVNTDTGELQVENKLIDAKALLSNPYKTLIEIWLQGSASNYLTNNCSQNTKINNARLEGNCAIIDLSKEFIEDYKGKEEQIPKTIYCIVNTLTELTEVESVKIIIDGEENKYLGNFNLSEKYCRIN